MSDILRPLRRKITKHKLASFDVETFNSDNDFYLVGLSYDNKYFCFYSVEDFYNHIKLYLRGYYIIATNLSFDLTSAFYKSIYWNEFDIISNGGFMLCASNKKLKVKFLDTLNWHKASVKQLGEIINIPKGDHPSFLGKRKPLNPLEEKVLRDYNEIDCKISLKFSEWFQEEINKLGGELKITIASTAMDTFKRKFLNINMVKEEYTLKKKNINEDIKNKLFNAYYGGRTEVLKRGYCEDLNYYDFNSLYPSVMIDELPLPNSVSYHKDGNIELIKFREGVSKVTISHDTDELPLLPYRYNGKLTFPSGKFTGYYTHIELREAIKNGYSIIKIFETISYSLTFKPFEKYVKTLYSKRLIAKKENNSSQLIYKLLMNSLYGKFGERYHKKVVHFDLKTLDVKQRKKLALENPLVNITLSDDMTGYYTIDEECNSAHVFPILAIYITAKARIKLWRVARLNDPYYMDTDSIITKSKLKSSKLLGELELEQTIKKAILIKPKMYYILNDKNEEIIKLKGVPKVTSEQFNKIMNKESVKYNKFVKLKEGIRRNLKINSVIEIEKNINLEDNKRIWDGEFNLKLQESKPQVIKDEIEKLQIKSCFTN